ncbi:hypothetical protein BDV26DRAFT_264120 [Aspergillus bertholletiae]|uniref:Uncharacterized protein n=1 Tax=Aspergillus bertholletiae TaxID=1226010 RepID=A0A5N7B5K9_9EURO|nr:hypothetical protein BDV26DRAFT_264120 [Aspergillus bertholletiae]
MRCTAYLASTSTPQMHILKYTPARPSTAQIPQELSRNNGTTIILSEAFHIGALDSVPAAVLVVRLVTDTRIPHSHTASSP